eukprot:TRINITY_DN701_c0_g1_i1.p1 TRINITY_DN701_c0_g1~~TRINITY_DN701_c0_g1_i1.p1  ORF type:complete len:358 (+),score=89.20 TRINITY_DN701_c0_g1_i1:20-1093(+)
MASKKDKDAQSSTRKSGSSIKADDGSGISTPYDVKHNLRVGTDLNWDASSPEDVFTIEKQIGKGAYGVVFRAVFKSSGFRIAVKKVVEDKNTQAKIQQEVDILKKSNHLHIVNYFGCVIGKDPPKKDDKSFQYPDSNEKAVWILMDFCGGGSIRDYMDGDETKGIPKAVLTEAQVAAVMVGVLQGLDYLHSQKVIHRDMKAANILLSEDGVVKIADFGISTQLNATVTGNQKTMIGTTYWMAPEILKEHYNYKIDIWSLGITAIEMAEGHPPNWQLKPFQLMMRLPNMTEPPPMKNPAQFSAEFRQFTQACLQIDPDKRPSAKQLLQTPFIMKHADPKGMTELVAAMAKNKDKPVAK